ncbi:MAG TPA: AAA family ATPase [Patescibacteria group bacterium]
MDNSTATKQILAIVGMPGSGKSEAVAYLQSKKIPVIRFGQYTDEGLTQQGLSLTPENERQFRENLRKELGMAAYAIKARAKIAELISREAVLAIDGLYSWEEYLYLKNLYPELILIHIYAEPKRRYARLAKRSVRPLQPEEARERDLNEIGKLNKGGPIAIADYLIENNEEKIAGLQQKMEALLSRLELTR